MEHTKQSSKIELVYITLVNWNGWENTIECLESLFRNKHLNFCVIVVDNDSQDDSLKNIISWARGELDIFEINHEINKKFTHRPTLKPLSYALYSCEEIESINSDNYNYPLILISSRNNLGFAAGNNIALKLILKQSNWKYIWILNNDTVIDKLALVELIKKCEQTPKIGMCGSTLLYYDRPQIIQALGGAIYNKWFARSELIASGKKLSKISDSDMIENKYYYVSGASLFISRDFLSTVGLMNEEYFLFFEELDKLGVSPSGTNSCIPGMDLSKISTIL